MDIKPMLPTAIIKRKILNSFANATLFVWYNFFL